MKAIKLLLLSGFNPLGFESWSLSKFFKPHMVCCPNKRNWTPYDYNYIMRQYRLAFRDDPMLVIAHSDGGTIAHSVAYRAPNCVGLIVHAGFFKKPDHLPTSHPVCLSICEYDITCMKLYHDKAVYWYWTNQTDAEQYILPRDVWHGHSVTPALPTWKEWCKRRLNYDLPLLDKYNATLP